MGDMTWTQRAGVAAQQTHHSRMECFPVANKVQGLWSKKDLRLNPRSAVCQQKNSLTSLSLSFLRKTYFAHLLWAVKCIYVRAQAHSSKPHGTESGTRRHSWLYDFDEDQWNSNALLELQASLKEKEMWKIKGWKDSEEKKCVLL